MNLMSKIIGLIALALIGTVSLTACSDKKSEKIIRIGTNIWPGYEPLYLARDTGLYDKSKVQLVEYPSASSVIRALKSRSIEAAALTLDEVLILLQHKIPVRVVLVLDISHGGDVIIAKPSIKTFADLAGKRVGVEGSALGAYVLSRALTVNHMSVKDITIVQLEADQHERSFTRGQVDAIVTFEPTRSILMKVGGVEVFTSREIPGEIVDVLVIREDALASSGGNVRHIIDGWFAALKRIKTDPQSSSAYIALRLGISPVAARANFEGLKLPDRAENIRLLGGQNPKLKPVVNVLEKTMREGNLLQGAIDSNALFNASALD